jgi:hypothetical protein
MLVPPAPLLNRTPLVFGLAGTLQNVAIINSLKMIIGSSKKMPAVALATTLTGRPGYPTVVGRWR